MRRALLNRTERVTYQLEQFSGNNQFCKLLLKADTITKCLISLTKSEWMQGLDMFWSSYPLLSLSMGQFVIGIAAAYGIFTVLRREAEKWKFWWSSEQTLQIFIDACFSGCIKTMIIALKLIRNATGTESFNRGFVCTLLYGHLRAMVFLKIKCNVRQEVMEVLYHWLTAELSRTKNKDIPTKIRSSARKLLIRWGCKID